MKTRRSKREIASLIVGFGITANSMRLRKRLSQIPTLDELPYGDLAKNGVLDDWVVISAEGVEINVGTMVVAIEYCRSNSLDAIDLIPSNIPVARAIEFLREYDPIEYKKNPLAEGRGANQAIVISKDAFVRTGLMKSEALDPFDMVQATKRVKQCCATSFISVIAPTLKVSSNLVRSRREWRGIYRDYDSIPLVMRIMEVTILVAMSVSRKLLNKFSFASFLLAPQIIFRKSNLAPRDLSLSPINRGFNEAFLNIKTIVQSPTLPGEVDMFEAKRPYYQKELENGIERFFEEPSATCPWCKGGPVNEFIHSRDYIQHKPGEFTLDKCDSCGHVFQNPRLTLDGLNFYYKDFYDGLGGEQIESVFGSLGIHYTRRCNLVAKYIEPQNWLDVGTGHGHFPIAAKQILSNTVFDGLDMSESVEDAVDRGWINKGYLGLFPEIAGTIDNSYDVVSMHHYLEHTRDPLAELDASVKVLKKGGYLLIEVPNPECKWGTVLKGKWMPWFQPQHQHMIPRANLEKALEERGFKVVDYEVEDSHQSAELLFAALFTIDSLAPDPRLPWLKPATTKSHIKRKAAFALGVVPVGIGALADKVLEKVVKKKEWSNAYRVLARFDGSSE